MAVETLHSRLAANAAPVQLPIGAESTLKESLISLKKKHISMMKRLQTSSLGKFPRIWSKPPAEAKQHLLEKIAAFDDDLMMLVLDGVTPEVKRNQTRYPSRSFNW